MIVEEGDKSAGEESYWAQWSILRPSQLPLSAETLLLGHSGPGDPVVGPRGKGLAVPWVGSFSGLLSASSSPMYMCDEVDGVLPQGQKHIQVLTLGGGTKVSGAKL